MTDPSAVTAAGSITDTAALALDGAQGIATFTSGGSTYAAVAAFYDDGVQILNVTDPSAVTAAGSITDTDALELYRAWDIAIFSSGGSTYAAVTAPDDGGVQILNVTDPSAVTAAGSITDTDALELYGAQGIAIFSSGGGTYAAVAAFYDGGVQILNVTDPSAVTAAGSIGDTDALELDGAWDITIFSSGGSTYAAVAADSDDGVQILDVTDPSAVTAAGSIADTGARELDGARGIATFTSGGGTYAAVAAFTDDGIQILRLADPPSAVTAAGSITDTVDLELDGAWDITIFSSGGSTYAAVTAFNDDGVQILDVTDPSAVTAAGSITDTGALALNGAQGIATFTSGGSTYAAVAADSDDGVQILDVTDPSAVTAAGSITDTAALALDGAQGIATFTSGGSTYAAVAAFYDDGVQILNVTDPSAVTAAGSITDTDALELYRAWDIAIFSSGGSTYAAVTAPDDGGVQILNVTDPSAVTAAGSITDTDALELYGAQGIAIFSSGGGTYAAVAAFYDGGVQILNVTDPSAVTAAGSIGDTDALELDGAWDITIFSSGGSTYAAVAADSDDGVQILDVTDPSAVTAAGSIADTGARELDGARGIATFTSGGGTYAAVAAFTDDGVQILRLADPPAATNSPPAVGAGADQVVAEGSTVALSGTTTDADPEDDLTYSWTHGSALAITITGSDSLSASFAAPNVAADTTFTVALTVNDGTVDVSDTLQVTIADSPNSPPAVGAGADQVVAEGATVSLSGTATDADPEDTLTYSWTHGSALAITITGSDSLSASFAAPNVAADTTFTVALTANDGTVDVSDALQVTIADSPNSPPAVEAGADQEVAKGATVSLSGTATDADPEDTLTYEWTHDGALSITITGSDSLSASFAAPDTATDTTITVTLTANDGTVGVSDALQVTVTDSPNSPPALVSSGLDIGTGALTMAFSEAIDAAGAVHSKMHVRESGTYEGGVTLTAAELGAAAGGSTISFTLTPAHLEAVRGLATPELTIEPGAVQDRFGNPIAGTFDVSTAEFVDSFDISAQDTAPTGMAFSNDGARMFVVGAASDQVHEYALSAPFDVSTASFVDSLDVSSQDALPSGMAFSSDGARMFVVGEQGDAVHEYALSAPFDASTASFVDSLDVSSQDALPSGMAFSSDGARMFVVGLASDQVHEYALSAPFDASTASFVDSFDVSSQDTAPTGMAFSNDGAKMFVVGLSGGDINEYALSAPFDVSAAAFANVTFSVSSQDNTPHGMAFSSDGARMFVVGSAGDAVHEYTLSSTYPIRVTDGTIPTLVSSGLDIVTGALTMAFSEVIDAAGVAHSKMHVRESGTYEGGVTLTAAELGTAAGGSTISFTLTPAHLAAVAGMATPELTIEPGAVQDAFGNPIAGTFDVSTASFVDSLDVSSQGMAPTGMAFSSDGARMFVVGAASDQVHEYALSAPFDVSTASFVDSFDVSSQDAIPTGMAFSNDGTRMFVVGLNDRDVNEYALSAPFDVSTAAFANVTFTVSSQEASPTGMAFSNDGARMFVVGEDSDQVHEYALSAPFDVSAASFVDSFGVWSQDTAPQGMAFSNDGAKMFVVGNFADSVHEYALSAPFDVSTASFVDSFGVSSQDTIPTGMAFSNDGAKMFVVGNRGDDVNEYTLSSTYPIRVTDGTIPTLVSSGLDIVTGALTMAFSEAIDAASAVHSKMHVRESGTYEGGVTLTAGELGAAAGGSTISFTLTPAHLEAVAGMATPELTIEPGAVQDAFGNPIAGTFDVSTAEFVDSFSVSSQETSPTGMAFSNDGARMFVVGLDSDQVHEYALPAPFDVSAASHVRSFGVSSQETRPTGVAFSSDGARMFVVGLDSDQVHEYALPAPFDVSAASHARSFGVSSQETRPTGVAFSSDGARMFVVGVDSGQVHEYALTAPFDVSTAALANVTFSISSQDTFPRGMAFSNDGARMFVAGDQGDAIHEYALTAPFDVSAATHARSFSVSSQDGRPSGVAFSSDGAKMLVIGNHGGAIHEYTLSSTYPIRVTGGTSFVTTWQTTSANETVTIPATGTYAIDWGDGIVNAAVTGPQTHTYAAAGSHTVSISAGLTRIHLNNHADAPKLISIDQWGSASWTSMAGAFNGARNMAYNATDAPDLSGVTDMASMFFSATSFDGDISAWNVSQVTGMDEMFGSAHAFNQPLNSWNVSQVTDMGRMFQDALAFNQPLNSWNVSQVTDMGRMFQDALAFNQPLNSWNVSQVTIMNNMFLYAESFNQPLNSWDVSQVTIMNSMFQRASAFNQPLNSWNVSSATSMDDMFFRASSFDQNLGEWYVGLSSTGISRSDVPGIVGEISAQNRFLDGQNPTYGTGSGGDSGLFEISNDNELNMTSVDTKSAYQVNITSTGSFGTANHRVVDVTVTGQAPVLGSIGAKSVDELATLSFTATATDGDNDTLEFTLAGTPPSGASINSTSGAFSWTPTEQQDGTHIITIQVEDGNGGSDSEAVTVTVNEVNVAPVLEEIGPKSVDELVTLTFTATATDGDVIGVADDALTFSLASGAPTGASITPAGAFSWTPTEQQDGTHTITIQVEDGSGATDSDTITVTVGEVNVEPVLASVGNKSVDELVTLTFTATATDGDVIGGTDDALTFSLASGAPTGASITPAGAFSWTPTAGQVGTHAVTVVVTDGSGATDSEAITVTVGGSNQNPVLNSIGPKGVNELATLSFIRPRQLTETTTS